MACACVRTPQFQKPRRRHALPHAPHLLEDTANDSFSQLPGPGIELDALLGRPHESVPQRTLPRAAPRTRACPAHRGHGRVAPAAVAGAGDHRGERRDETTFRRTTRHAGPDRRAGDRERPSRTSTPRSTPPHSRARVGGPRRARARGDPVAGPESCAADATGSPPWRSASAASRGHEADADVCEAIDFLEYYALQAITLERSNGLVQLPGERNTLRYAARGVVAVVGPWNFPLAIPAGMSPPASRPATASCSSPPSSRPRARSPSSRPCTRPACPRPRRTCSRARATSGAARRAPGVHTIAFTGSGAVGLEHHRARPPSSPPASAASSASWPRWAARTA